MTKLEKWLIAKGHDLGSLKKDEKSYETTNIKEAAERILAAVRSKQHIHVVADYDCDGMMSGYSMDLILKHLGADYKIRFPKKMSEGYGFSGKILSEIPDGSLIITVDNGISSVEAVEAAKMKKCGVIIIDHHEIRGDHLLPNADIIVDPHIFSVEGEFVHYCGAGLSLVLARELKMPEDIMSTITALASIATVADIVSLTGDNRNIVRRGLWLINNQKFDSDGLKALISAVKLEMKNSIYSGVTATDIGFQIAPCINAMGRMIDNGAELCVEYLSKFQKYGMAGIDEIITTNALRKEKTKQQNEMIDSIISVSDSTTCCVAYHPDFFEGILGINAAYLKEKFKLPSIVFTDAEGGILKGSMRGVDGGNVKAALDEVQDILVAYGGHPGAAGLSIKREDLDLFTKRINQVIPKVEESNSDWNPDIVLREDELMGFYKESYFYGPWGCGFPAPKISVVPYSLKKSYGKTYRLVGANGLSFNGDFSECIAFSDELREKYISGGEPSCLEVLGTVGWSKYSHRPQVMMEDFRETDFEQEYLI